jgi:hypothetical protein
MVENVKKIKRNDFKNSSIDFTADELYFLLLQIQSHNDFEGIFGYDSASEEHAEDVAVSILRKIRATCK